MLEKATLLMVALSTEEDQMAPTGPGILPPSSLSNRVLFSNEVCLHLSRKCLLITMLSRTMAE
jgi:hypothetical protein